MENSEAKQGRRSCSWCCGGGILDVGSGYFRDFDSDFSYGIPVCGGCGGLGIAFEGDDFRQRIKEIMRLRFEYCPVFGPELPVALRLKALEALAEKVIEIHRLYGPSGVESVAARIAGGALSGEIAALRKAKEEQKEYLRTALIEPEECRAALLAAHDGDVEKADTLFREVVERHPRHSVASHDYGTFLAVFKRSYELALPWFVKATELEPRKALHCLQAARCLSALKREADARVFLRKATTCPDAEATPGLREALAEAETAEAHGN